METTLYTAGEIARTAGVSLRTIRYYDARGLLKPVSYSEAGYRYYNGESLTVLQRILMLKYLGFSLHNIESIMKDERTPLQLSEQKAFLLQKKAHLEELISAIEMAEESEECDRWAYLIRLLNLLSEEEKVKEQYETSSNLEKRIQLHDYSTSAQSWMEWVYDRLKLQEGEQVLELGCGTGLLWQTNIHRLPRGLCLTLTDRSQGMLEKTKENLAVFQELLKEKEIKIEYRREDADCLHLEKAQYHCIIANHMLYHVQKREACLKEIAGSLKNGGRFICSTIGESHMKELHDMVEAFDKRIEIPFRKITAGFRLENGEEQLAPFFSCIECMEQENDLIVDDIEAVYHYVCSYPGNAALILEQRGQEFRRLLQERMEKEGAIFIHKSSGLFCCRL